MLDVPIKSSLTMLAGLPVATKLGLASVGFWVGAPMGNFFSYFSGTPSFPAVMPSMISWSIKSSISSIELLSLVS